MINNRIFKFLISSFVLIGSMSAYAVTQKEMEEARTIATKSYLRYANDGSGYLDDLNPKTMEELEAALKTKEKENIKAFKAIPVPTDYKDWGKEKLVEYWVNAFQTKGLLEKGRGGRIRTRSLINKMDIGAPEPEPTTPSVADNTPSAETPASVAESPANPATEIKELKAEENALLAEETIEEVTPVEKAGNYTWVYIMILAIIVAIVLALIIYASNVLKKNGLNSQGMPLSEEDAQKYSETLEKYESAIADKEVEIAMLNKKVDSLTRQNNELKSKLESVSAELASITSSFRSGGDKSGNNRDYRGGEQGNSRTSVRSIYLGRANARGVFVRADRNLNVGNSIFVLDTSDGYSGTFRVADSPAAWSLALSNPKEYLETACTGYDLDDPGSASRIVTESSGTAVFEGGCWRVIRKARIRYQ